MNEPWLLQTCKAWPGVTFDVKWGNDFVASVGGKMFAVVEAKKKDSGISFKVPADRFLELTDQTGIEPAPYVARYKWVRIPAPKALGERWLSKAVRTSYELVRDKLPKKVREGLQG